MGDDINTIGNRLSSRADKNRCKSIMITAFLSSKDARFFATPRVPINRLIVPYSVSYTHLTLPTTPYV